MAMFNLATLDAAERNYAEAKKRYEQILAKDPKSERALLGLAHSDILNNAPPADVAAAIQRAIAANPDSAAVASRSSSTIWRAARTGRQP